ncbi:UDP-galactopyranose mutase [Candidatus Nanosyncoccus nanoralicus]|uniref:UDP-galactopyranose mutase n=2 Tax=Candidatus Nanosyncoccus nanoralicus TaxID=2171996 RepID=A0ABY0FKR1_9BACT|nr:UDP-galactopyranose mutase [Candidatus Nanosyncoccus nanoralicus]
MFQSENIEVRLNTSFKDLPADLKMLTTIYTGPVDELLNYELGILPYRSLHFETEWTKESLGCAVINEADKNIPYTRTHDYKYYQIHQPEVLASKKSYLCKEYPADYEVGKEAYYPVNNTESEVLYQKYLELLKERYPNIILGGRLGAYRYWDMDIAIKNALDLAALILKNKNIS